MSSVLPKWEEVKEISTSLDANRLPSTDDLVGQKLTLVSSSTKSSVEYQFMDEKQLTWR